MKPVKNAISYVIYTEDRSKFLIVKRPDDDENLPGAWGLPAGSVKEDESFEKATLRSGKQKLGVKLKIIKLIGEDQTEREKYILNMKEYEAEIVHGKPKAPQPIKGITQYQAIKWGTSEDLHEAVSKGSLCCKMYLDYENKGFYSK